MGGSNFLMEKSLHLTLISFMDELYDIFWLKLPSNAVQIGKNYFCAMGLTKKL